MGVLPYVWVMFPGCLLSGQREGGTRGIRGAWEKTWSKTTGSGGGGGVGIGQVGAALTSGCLESRDRRAELSARARHPSCPFHFHFSGQRSAGAVSEESG